MIKFITTPNPNLLQSTVSGNSGPYHSGAIYWDGSQQKFKVIDGQGQTQDMYGATASIEPGFDLKEMHAWWLEKKAEEANIKALCEKYPNLAEARQEYEILYKLVKDHK